MIAEIEVIVRTSEQAQKFQVGKLVGSGSNDLHRALEGPRSRELLARTLVDWAAGYADLEIDVRGPVEPETEQL